MRYPKYHSGFSLMEVLISMTLLFLLLLGVMNLQFTSLKQAKSTYYFHVASQQLYAMSERLNIFKQQGLSNQIIEWNKQNQLALPQGKGSVIGSFPHYELVIFWGKYSLPICEKNKIGPSGCLHLFFEVTH